MSKPLTKELILSDLADDLAAGELVQQALPGHAAAIRKLIADYEALSSQLTRYREALEFSEAALCAAQDVFTLSRETEGARLMCVALDKARAALQDHKEKP